jgi:RNase P subunit RPR2
MTKNKKLLEEIASGRIESLLSMARTRTLQNSAGDDLSRRYVGMAQNIISHYKIPAGRRMRREVCASCSTVLIAGVNCSVRLASQYGYVSYRCACGKERHVMYRSHGPKLLEQQV